MASEQDTNGHGHGGDQAQRPWLLEVMIKKLILKGMRESLKSVPPTVYTLARESACKPEEDGAHVSIRTKPRRAPSWSQCEVFVHIII